MSILSSLGTKRVAAVIVGLALLAGGCFRAAAPDVEATMQAAIEATQAARPAEEVGESPTIPPPATLTLTPTPEPTHAPQPTDTPRPTDAPQPTDAPEPTVDVTDCSLGATFMQDVTIPDNTEIRRGDTFTKTWRMRNTGSCAWTAGYRLTFIEGEQMGGVDAVRVPETNPGDSGDVSVGLVGPNVDGRYRGTWRMCVNGDVCFGDRVYVQVISVPPSSAPGPTPTTPGPTPTTTGPTPTKTGATPAATVLTCDDILASNQDLTAAQWGVYEEKLEGAQVTGWPGKITKVGDKSTLAGGYPVHIEIVPNCRIYYVIKEEDVALGFTSGQSVIVSGEIEIVSTILGRITLHMVDETVHVE